MSQSVCCPTQIDESLLSLQGLLFGKQTLLVLFELFQALVLLVNMLLFELSDFGLPSFSFLCPANGLLLANDDGVCTAEESFNFLLIGILDGSVHDTVLLVLAVQVEDHLGQLGDLLGHLVMSLFVHLSFLSSLPYSVSMFFSNIYLTIGTKMEHQAFTVLSRLNLFKFFQSISRDLFIKSI